MKIRMAPFFLLACFYTHAQSISIPDANFKNTLVNDTVADFDGDGNLDGDVDTNNDGEIQYYEALAVHTLRIDGRQISSLDGIEAFENLAILSASSNDISEIDVFNNQQLIQLNVHSNNLSSIDVSNNVLLEGLYLISNNISNINVSQNINLKELDVRLNYLTSINVSTLTALEKLYVSSNGISSLDLSNNSKLRVLDAHTNQISFIDITQCADLISVELSQNNLTEIDVSNNPNLLNILVPDNNLTSLDTSNNPVVSYIYCFNNSISSLDLSTNTVLRAVHAYNNSLVSVNFANGDNSNINYFYVQDNPELVCIQVDNENYSNNQTCYYPGGGWCKDETATYNDDCEFETETEIESEDVVVNETLLSPNPAGDSVTVYAEYAIDRIRVYNLHGNLVGKFEISNTLNISGLTAGIYYVEVVSGGQRSMAKFVKN